MKKSTQELLDAMKSSRDYTEYLSTNRCDISDDCMKVAQALRVLLEEKKLKKADVIARSGIEVHYGYQIFSGTKSPTRDKVLMLAIGFSLSPEETQNFLKITGYAPLYGKNIRDNAILFALTKGKSVIDLNAELYELGLDLLI